MIEQLEENFTLGSFVSVRPASVLSVLTALALTFT
jgi:hypothetical protein